MTKWLRSISLLRYEYMWLCILLPTLVYTQQLSSPFRNYTIANGLPSSECYEVIQDQEGYIWVSTDNGVSRFDGYTFKNFGPNEGLTDRTVLFMHEDHRGWIWMSTFSGNFYIYKGGEQVVPYPYNKVFTSRRSLYNTPHDFIIDSVGTLHVALQHYGVIAVDSTGQTKEYVDDDAYPYRYGMYRVGYQGLSVLQYQDNFLPRQSTLRRLQRLKTLQRLDFIDYANDSITHHQLEITHLPTLGTTRNLAVYSFLTTEGIFFQYYDHLYLFDHKYQLLAQTTIGKKQINCLKILANGHLAIGYFDRGGMDIYPSLEALFTSNSTSKRSLLLGKTVSHITEDSAGNLWVTTIENGLFLFPFPDVHALMLPQDVLSSNSRYFVDLTLLNDKLYCLDSRGYLLQLDTLLHRQAEIKAPYLDRPLSVQAIPEYDAIITNSNLSIYQTNQAKWTRSVNKLKPEVYILYDDTLSMDAPNQVVNQALYDAKRKVIWATNGHILYQSTKPPPYFSPFQIKNVFPNIQRFTSLQVDSYTEGLWLSSYNELHYYNYNTDSLHTILPQAELLTTRIKCIQPLAPDRLLIGTQKAGLLLIHHALTDSAQLERVSSSPRTPVVDIHYQATKGYVWVTTPEGVLRYHANDLQAKPLNYPKLRRNNDAILKVLSSADHLFVLYAQQLLRLPSTLSSKRLALPPTVSLHQAGDTTHTLDYSRIPMATTLHIQITPFDYQTAPYTMLRYRLKETSEWIKTTNPRLTFNNLSPDYYRFEVQAQNSVGEWSLPTYLSFRILPPLRQRWWFLLIILSVASSIIYYIVRSQFKQLKARQIQQDLQLKLERTQQQAYQAQMNPHFIFNSLNAIQGFILGDSNEQKQAVSFLSQFSMLVRKSLNYAQQEYIPLSEDIQMIKEYLALEQMRFGSKLSFEVDAEGIDPELVLIPPMLVQPLVENAVLHGLPKNKQGKIHVQYLRHDKQLLVRIIDNGPGYTTALKYRHQYRNTAPKGLRITRERLQLLTSDTLQAPTKLILLEPHDEAGVVQGTEVQLWLPWLSYYTDDEVAYLR